MNLGRVSIIPTNSRQSAFLISDGSTHRRIAAIQKHPVLNPVLAAVLDIGSSEMGFKVVSDAAPNPVLDLQNSPEELCV